MKVSVDAFRGIRAEVFDLGSWIFDIGFRVSHGTRTQSDFVSLTPADQIQTSKIQHPTSNIDLSNPEIENSVTTSRNWLAP